MAEKIVKARLITWFTEVEDPTIPGGSVMRENIASLGERVDIPDKDVERLERLGGIYSAEDQSAIEAGEYNGFDRHLLAAAQSGVKPQGVITPVAGEGFDTSSMDAEELGNYIRENNLTVPDTLALLPEDADEDEINRFFDAENYASDNQPRKGVTDKLEAMLAASTQRS